MSFDKEVINRYRYSGDIEGKTPFVMRRNKSTNYLTFKSSRYIVALKDNYLNFYSLHLFKLALNNKDDFRIDLNEFTSFDFIHVSGGYEGLVLYSKDHKKLVMLISDSVKYYYSLSNALSLLKELEKIGLKNMSKKKELSEKELIKKYEGKKTSNFDKLKKDYLEQTDKNYKDGDRN